MATELVGRAGAGKDGVAGGAPTASFGSGTAGALMLCEFDELDSAGAEL